MIKIIRGAISVIVVAVLVVLLAVFLVPRFFGYRPYMVVSASMQQSFPVGSLIFVTDATPADVEIGDPITFTSGDLVITHRVMEKHDEKGYFITKGDNNAASEVTRYVNLKGKALNFCIPQMGYFAAWFITWQGKFITIMILASLALLNLTLGKLQEMDETEERDADGETDADGKTAPRAGSDSGESADASAPPQTQ